MDRNCPCLLLFLTQNVRNGDDILLRKKCKVCGKSSYSASEHRVWLCPYCDTDLTKDKIMDANISEAAEAYQSLILLKIKCSCEDA